MSFASKLNFLKLKKSPENRILKEIKILAERRSGVIHVSEVALNLNISKEKAQSALEYFVKSGDASMDVSSRGIIKYEFREFATAAND